MDCSNRSILVIWDVVNELQKARESCIGDRDILAKLGDVEMSLFRIMREIALKLEKEQIHSVLSDEPIATLRQSPINVAPEPDIAAAD